MPRQKGYRDKGWLSFLALLPEIKDARAHGRSLKGLHEEHRDRLGFGYVQLTRFWRAYTALKPEVAGKPVSLPSGRERTFGNGFLRLPQDDLPPEHAAALAQLQIPAPPPDFTEKLSTISEAPRDFHYDPMDAYRYEFGLKVTEKNDDQRV